MWMSQRCSTPDTRRRKKRYTPGKEAREDITAVRQARRCEQYAFRIQIATKDTTDGKKKEEHAKLNKEAIQQIRKYSGTEQWEWDLLEKLEGTRDRNTNIMLVPTLKQAASKYHGKAKTHRDKAVQIEDQRRAERYSEKSGGQWQICKDMGGNLGAPLVAVKRTEAGPKGQAKGTIATSPKEVDSILRKVLDKIYDGNTKDPEKNGKGLYANI